MSISDSDMMQLNPRRSDLVISKEDFRQTGYFLVDALADYFDTIADRPVTSGESPSQINAVLGTAGLPDEGKPVQDIMEGAVELLTAHSLFNGHPRFFGYITSSPAPVGALADLLAASINPNVGANILSPMATAMERQTVKWLAEFIGVPDTYGGILVSGGNMANFTAFLAARTAKLPKAMKDGGLRHLDKAPYFYCSKATHTWIEKAATLFGHGLNGLRWVPVDRENKMDLKALELQIKEDIAAGNQPFLVVGNAGDVSTGVVDNLVEIATVCKRYDLWFHIDGAYGIPAAAVPELKSVFEGIQDADSIALDPHKWLYAPLEAGCTLVKNAQHLIDTYSSHPVYYNFSNQDDQPALNFYEYGFQNSRGFRALKVWMALQQVGRKGYIEMISDDIRLSKLLFELANQHPELQALTQNLSIATLRYVPGKLNDGDAYLNALNEALLNALQQGGEVFLSNAVLDGNYYLRCCIVNFRTTEKDIQDLVDIIVRVGRKVHLELQEK